MPVTPEALETVRKVAAETARILADPVEKARVLRLIQHQEEVEAGLIPASSPPDFIRADWGKAEDHGNRPGWYGPSWDPEEAQLRAEAYAGDSTQDDHRSKPTDD